jgi:protein arginine N-methyltransferase 1
MLMDSAGTLAFQRAIESVVKPGDTVVNGGSGSGIVSFFSARSGAGKVYGLEITNMAEEAREIAKDNALSDHVEFVHIDAGEFEPPKEIDVLLGEWVGYYLIEQWHHFEVFSRLRDKHLSKSGAVMLSRIKLFFCPVDDSRLYMECGHGFWEAPVYGFNFEHAGRSQYKEPHRVLVQADKRILLEAHEIFDMNCLTAKASDMFFESSFETGMRGPARCHGYIGFFLLDLAPGATTDTSPFSRKHAGSSRIFRLRPSPWRLMTS